MFYNVEIYTGEDDDEPLIFMSSYRNEVVRYIGKNVGWFAKVMLSYILKKVEGGTMEKIEYIDKHHRTVIRFNYD